MLILQITKIWSVIRNKQKCKSKIYKKDYQKVFLCFSLGSFKEKKACNYSIHQYCRHFVVIALIMWRTCGTAKIIFLDWTKRWIFRALQHYIWYFCSKLNYKELNLYFSVSIFHALVYKRLSEFDQWTMENSKNNFFPGVIGARFTDDIL